MAASERQQTAEALRALGWGTEDLALLNQEERRLLALHETRPTESVRRAWFGDGRRARRAAMEQTARRSLAYVVGRLAKEGVPWARREVRRRKRGSLA